MTTLLAIFLLIVLAAWPLTKLALWKRRLRALEEAKSTGDAKRASEILLSLYRLRPKNIEFLRELIDLHLESKDLPQAETELLLRAHRAFPEDDRYVKALAGEFSASGRRDREACRIFAHRVRISARPGPWAFTLAQTYCALGEYDLATRAYHQAVRHGLDDPQLPGALAELYVKLQITGPQALPTLKEVFSLNTGNVPFLKVFCESCRANRLFDEQSIEAARALLGSDPSAAQGHELLSAHFLRQGKLQDSIRHGRAALESDPQSEVASLLLATCYARETRRDESAMQLYRQVVSANPKAQEILLTLSRAYIHAGRDDREAEDILRRTLDQAPSDAMILTHLAAIAARNEDYDLAVQTCEELQVLGDSSPGRILQLAEAYCAGRVMNDKAERTCRRALLHQPGNERLIGHLARIYGAQGRTDPPAVAVYERAFERDPDPEVGRLLAESYVQSQRMEKALSMARRVLRINPKEQSLEKLIVDAGAELDRLNAAISEQESTLHRDPNNEEAICRLAELYGAQRRYDADALEIYRRAAILHPEDAGHHTAVVRACADQGDWDAVLGAVQQFLSHTPANINPAIALMEELSKTRPEALKLRWFLVETLIFGGKFRRAMGHLDNITDLDSGQGERALASYDRIIEKAPDETEA
ncbi:tetratricopeptide repeat protein, partial [Candidatus Sumerlaeota bacterium]|nr:tetratricopeptide repeat protein [Candidatus Sumerlaeota bacterium]